MPPVEDHPIHPSTQKGADFRYGCHNRRPFSSGYYAPHRVYGFDGLFTVELKWIPFAMSRDCKFDMPNDPGCEGCRHALTAKSDP